MVVAETLAFSSRDHYGGLNRDRWASITEENSSQKSELSRKTMTLIILFISCPSRYSFSHAYHSMIYTYPSFVRLRMFNGVALQAVLIASCLI